MLIKTFAFSILSLAACVSAQAASRVLDNVSVDALNGATVGSTIGVSFVTGSTAMTVTDVVFPQIYQATPSSAQVNTFSTSETFSLYTNNPANNTPLALFPVSFALDNDTTLVSGNPGYGQTQALPSASMLLAPNTRYWLELSGASTVYWDYTNSTTYASALGVTLPTTNTSFETNGATTYFTLAQGPQQFVLDVNAVPEPSTYCLMAVAGLALVVSRKRSVKVA